MKVRAAARRCKYINLYWKESIMKRNYQNHGFTIVELLTVMAVIALLIGLLVPGLNKVRIYAKGVKQNAQFHSVSVALEMFKNENGGEYPDSSLSPDTTLTCGAQKLAEALIGRDQQGFDPQSTWNAQADSANKKIYANVPRSTQTEQDDSLARRKGPYLNLQSAGAFNPCQFLRDAKNNPVVSDLYPGSDGTVSPPSMPPAPMLSDIYTTKTVPLTIVTGAGTTITTSAKAGMPVLYFKANTAATYFGPTPPSGNYSNDVYNYNDNAPIFEACNQIAHNNNTSMTGNQPFFDPGGTGNVPKFYDKITNPSSTTMLRPYNADSFILLSAGYDAIYGTSDDVWNFGE
jgi:prepilin-type N-terminal cleavage/methylation domain-containing protein